LNFHNSEGLLHDYRFVGENYRDRERILKKRKRWLNKLRGLDATERNAIIHDLNLLKKAPPEEWGS